MIGEPAVMQEALVYEFSLFERHVPADHLLRSIGRFVRPVRHPSRTCDPFYSEIGRPSVDPELMIRMLIVGYCFGIRSERRLCEEAHLIPPIAGSAGSAWRAASRITRPSRRTGTAVSATVTCCANCSRRRCAAASRKDW